MILTFIRTCKAANALCIPFVFRNLNVLRTLDTSFEEFYDLIVKPYAIYAKIVRIRLSDSLTDEYAAKILAATISATDLLLYHVDFYPSDDAKLHRELNVESDNGGVAVDNGNQADDESESSETTDWMHCTTIATIGLLENRSLHSLGVYADSVIGHNGRDYLSEPGATILLLTKVLHNPIACTSLKKLDIALHSIPEGVYDPLRQNLPSLISFTVNHAFRSKLPKLWDATSHQNLKWKMSNGLTQLSLKNCANACAAHIPHLVRHLPSLKHLLVSSCGFLGDKYVDGPPNGWYSMEDALWKVRPPLDTFQIEHMDHWEIGSMAEIPAKKVIFANTGGRHLVRALKYDMHHFPELEVVSVESPSIRSAGIHQFRSADFMDLEEICEARGVSIVYDAVPTSLRPSHFYYLSFPI
jgi:hypothetical protein